MAKLKLWISISLIGLIVSSCSFSLLKPQKDPFYTVILQKDTHHPFALYAQGQILLAQGHFEDAIPYFKKLTQADPRHAGGWIGLGQCSLELQKYAQAQNAFRQAINLNSGPEAHFGLALALLMGGRVEEAKKEADSLRSTLEDSFQLMSLYGHIAIVEGDYQSALDFYRKSVEINPSQEPIQKRIRDLESFLANR